MQRLQFQHNCSERGLYTVLVGLLLFAFFVFFSMISFSIISTPFCHLFFLSGGGYFEAEFEFAIVCFHLVSLLCRFRCGYFLWFYYITFERVCQASGRNISLIFQQIFRYSLFNFSMYSGL